MKNGRRIAFDYGSVRIGVAASDLSGLIASPVATLETGSSELSTQLSELIAEYEPIYMAVGEPRHLSGSASQTMGDVADFVILLKSLSDVPIVMIDERLSTVSATKSLQASGKTAKESRKVIDSMAAVAILESALNRERLQGTR